MIQNTITFRVRYAETDKMGIAHHSSYVLWFEMARIELMRSIGISYAQFEKDGYLMPVLEINLQYKKAVTFDQLLNITASINQKPKARFKYNYQISNRDEIICEGYSIHGYMNLQNKAIKPPKAFLNKINEYFKEIT
ncbi:MAG: thioesterase family protein [Calditrichaceae bacterium]|jgi:acyl-CoA thioester hydrolase